MYNWRQAFSDLNYIFREELRTIIRDKGVIIFFFLVPIGYPLLYTFIYTNEVVREVPVAVVDDCRSHRAANICATSTHRPMCTSYRTVPT